MGKSLEETQERVRAAEGRITEVDAKAAAAGDSATKANAAAARSGQPRHRSRTHRGSARGQHRRRNPQADLRDRAERRPRQVQARQGRAAGRRQGARIDTMVNQLKTDKKAVWVEIEGHTDNVGDKTLQRALGLDARRSREAVSLREAPGAAAQDQRDQLRRRQAGGAEQHPRRPRAEPPRRDQGPRLDGSADAAWLMRSGEAGCPAGGSASSREALGRDAPAVFLVHF